MTRTLDSFNAEWYELQAKGRLGEEYTTKVPDIYLRNEELDEQVKVRNIYYQHYSYYRPQVCCYLQGLVRRLGVCGCRSRSWSWS